MLRCSRWVFIIAAAVAILLIPFADNLYAQSNTSVTAGRPGGYLSWWKLLVIAIVFIVWVRTTDWINRDSMKIASKTGMLQEVWNPLLVFSFLIGFLCVISVPWFFAGLPIYLIAAWLPLLIYFFRRRKKFKADPNIKNYLSLKPGEAPPAEALPQDEGVEVSFTAAGTDKNSIQANLIRARQATAFSELKEFLIMTQFKRAEKVLLDYTRDAVSGRLLVDGSWHTLDVMDRETGDSILQGLKNLAGLNANERRAKQVGRFKLKSELGKAEFQLTTQGVPTGERAEIFYIRGAQKIMSLSQLGMFPDMLETIKVSLNESGLTIISAPPGAGLTATWMGALTTSDRLTRDCVALISDEETETSIENIVPNKTKGKPQNEALKALLLTQPDMVVVPEIDSPETMDILTLHGADQDRSILTRTSAKSAAEALLRVYAKAGDRPQFLRALKNVTCQRLVRRLCTACRVEVRVQPNIIQKLGGNPKTQGTVFNPWQLPPPEQRVDEKGREIEFPPCKTCGGLGFIGRIAIFEMITVDDQLRDVIKKNPKIAAVEQVAAKLGKQPLATQAYKLVLLGVTSLSEAQRVLKQN
ncbi:MAG: ATPase, T2SS/T4P/T4SS family [Mariniblastus sp.]|nr:ATPase, T2SS/T4P/T4SS family [Mariniblastus sp.]